MLKEKLSEDDQALVEVLEDPVWFVEFMRTTRDASPHKETWLKEPFQYRWYQRDLLTDKSEQIALLGGRAVGKCQPVQARVYTTEGYLTIEKLRRRQYFSVYALKDGKYVQRRAYCQKDRWDDVYTVTSQNNHQVHATLSHPFLTRNGYVTLKSLKVGDEVAVTQYLPHESVQRAMSWAELRFFGYLFFHKSWRTESYYYPRYKRIKSDMYQIAQSLNMRYLDGGEYILLARKDNYKKNHFTNLMKLLNMQAVQRHSYDLSYPRHIPELLKRECLEHIQYFLEAVIAQYANITRKEVILNCYTRRSAVDFQEMLLRFGVDSIVDDDGLLTITDEVSLYRLFKTFQFPGVEVEIQDREDYQETIRYEPITKIELFKEKVVTYAIQVEQDQNYVSDNFAVHNSLVLEDKFLFDTMNNDVIAPETKETLLTTANQAQMEPVLGRLITRFTSNPLFKEYLQNRINRSLGIMDFRFSGIQWLIRSRIAGAKQENSLVGLHLPYMRIDEAQLYSLSAYRQLLPGINAWEANTQIFVCGVPNGITNSLLYYADRKLKRFKKYHVPAHNNPFYTRADDIENIKNYGGEDSDDYQQLVLGRHGSASYSVITRDQIIQETYPFYQLRFTGLDVERGGEFERMLDRPLLGEYTSLAAGIDMGFVDPTIISIFARSEDGIWRHVLRYRLHRVDFNTQERIFHWLHQHYHFEVMAIDAGAGGGGTQVMHSLLHREEYGDTYHGVVEPIQFGGNVVVGMDTEGKELTQQSKTLGADNLVQLLQSGIIRLSEVDAEAVSELERMTKQKTFMGADRYYIMNERGNGASPQDHIFASFICFAVAIRNIQYLQKPKRRLGRSRGKHL